VWFFPCFRFCQSGPALLSFLQPSGFSLLIQNVLCSRLSFSCRYWLPSFLLRSLLVLICWSLPMEFCFSCRPSEYPPCGLSHSPSKTLPAKDIDPLIAFFPLFSYCYWPRPFFYPASFTPAAFCLMKHGHTLETFLCLDNRCRGSGERLSRQGPSCATSGQ